MSKEYIVVAIERIRTTYIVPADSEEEAREKVEHPEESYQIEREDYEDLESIVSVEENI